MSKQVIHAVPPGSNGLNELRTFKVDSINCRPHKMSRSRTRLTKPSCRLLPFYSFSDPLVWYMKPVKKDFVFIDSLLSSINC
jgi:hypothetical protein